MTRRYARIGGPWNAVADRDAAAPAAFYARLLSESLRYGLPARRRFGPAVALAARAPHPVVPVASVLRRRPAVERRDVDALIAATLDAWDALAGSSMRLPRRPPALAALALERSAGLTVFLFGESPSPLVVLKSPRGDKIRLAVEAAALQEAAPARVGPLHLGRVGVAFAQEGLAGTHPAVPALSPARARHVAWPPALAALRGGLCELAAATAKPVFADQLTRPVERALSHLAPASQASRALAAAWRSVRRIQVAVLRHHDTSPQNCLVSGDGVLEGLIDWEMAVSQGAPGFDVWNAVQAWLIGGVGLSRWSEDRVVASFEAAWTSSELWRCGRAAARDAARAGGVAEQALDALEVVFFGSRVGDRLLRPAWHPTGPEMASRLLDVVVGASG